MLIHTPSMFLRNRKPPFRLKRFPPEVSIANDIVLDMSSESSEKAYVLFIACTYQQTCMLH